ncbi:MAG: hypothetical protein U0359_04825 [Byssovorax sp.]
MDNDSAFVDRSRLIGFVERADRDPGYWNQLQRMSADDLLEELGFGEMLSDSRLLPVETPVWEEGVSDRRWIAGRIGGRGMGERPCAPGMMSETTNDSDIVIVDFPIICAAIAGAHPPPGWGGDAQEDGAVRGDVVNNVGGALDEGLLICNSFETRGVMCGTIVIDGRIRR